MEKTRSIKRIPVIFFLCILLSLLLTVKASAEEITVSTSLTPSYFQTLSSRGQWSDIGTPLHMINETGQVAYCLQTDYRSPDSSGYSKVDGSDYYDQTTLSGLRAILENGYPNRDGGFGSDEARYATANAIRFWLAEQGAEGVPGWMDLSRFSEFFRGKAGYEDLFDWSLELLDKARNQAVGVGSINFSPSEITLSPDGTHFKGQVTVTLNNCSNYGILYETLPHGILIDGATGRSGDVLKIDATSDFAGTTNEISFGGCSTVGDAKLLFFAPYDSGEQRVVAYEVGVGSSNITAKLTIKVPEIKTPTAGLKIIKIDADTGRPIPGVTFAIGDAGGHQIRAGTTDENGVVEFTDFALGSYFYLEESAPEGYIVDNYAHSFYLGTEGQVKEVTVKNTRSKGRITVHKCDAEGNPLEGITFTLSSSSDGGKTFAGISSAATDSSGGIAFEDLDMGLIYRLTEENTLPGLALCPNPIYEGSLDDEELNLTVSNCPVTSLPFTGGMGFTYIPLAALVLCTGFYFTQKLKRRTNNEENF